jgi:hypothetical protein
LVPSLEFFFTFQSHSDLNDQNLFHSTIDTPPRDARGVKKSG